MFALGGLGGIPFTGRTGWGAFSAHVPEGGNAMVVFGPHVGIDSRGTVGKIERMGQSHSTTCCGAAVLAGLYRRASHKRSILKRNSFGRPYSFNESPPLPLKDATCFVCMFNMHTSDKAPLAIEQLILSRNATRHCSSYEYIGIIEIARAFLTQIFVLLRSICGPCACVDLTLGGHRCLRCNGSAAIARRTRHTAAGVDETGQ